MSAEPTSSRAEQTVLTNGIRLSYEKPGSGEPALLIMGLGAGRSAWQPHQQHWEQRFTCIAADNRGAGQSSAPDGPYTTAMMADDYAGLIHSLGIAPVRVVGISMGGAIAQELALRHPELVQRMVLVATWAKCDAYTDEVFDCLAALNAQAGHEKFSQLLQLWIWSPRHMGSHLDQLRAERSSPPAVTPAAFAAQAAACRSHDTLDQLGNINVPTLITAGTADTLVPVQHAQQLHAGIAGSELRLFTGAGHAHHWEALDRFNNEVAEWLT